MQTNVINWFRLMKILIPVRFVGKACLMVYLLTVLILEMPALAAGQGSGASGEAMPRWGLGAVYGNSFGPRDNIRFMMVDGFYRIEQSDLWRHPLLDALKWKIEANLGSHIEPEDKFIGSLGITAQYYITALATSLIKPYMEVNLSAIYTDFRVYRQAQNWNFNPQAGIGADLHLGSGPPFFVSLRYHHISNAGLSEANVGVDSMILMFGRYF